MFSNEDNLDGKILTVIYSIGLHVIFNRFALENVVLGAIQPGDKIPYEEYLDALETKGYEQYMIREAVQGKVIEQDETITVQPMENFCRQFFIEQIETMFAYAPKHKNTSEETDIPQYKFGLYEYLSDLYKIYKEILLTEVHPDYFDYLYDFIDRRELLKSDAFTAKFVTTIKLKKLRKGTRVDRYIKRISYHSEYLNRLIRIHKGHYILINNDTDSLDYKLALISALCFCTGRNKGLFELKIKAWEKEKSEQTLQF